MIPLRVASDHRHLERADGTPFFWLADTAWELFHALDRDEAGHYLRTRAEQGFTVIQAVALAEFDGLRRPNAYGQVPFDACDPLRPVEAYWAHVDGIVARANALGLVVGFLPTWGDKWHAKWGKGPEIFTPENAHAYGAWLGRRYRDADLVWILGGDRPFEDPRHFAITDAMAAGVREGDGGAHRITLHPCGGQHSADSVHERGWLDFNMVQSGHGELYTANWAMLAKDWARTPAKPILDGEPCYEDHPVRRRTEQGWFDEREVRRACWWALCSGALGHTYGCHGIWGFYDPAKRQRDADPRTPWQQSLHLPGANQMRHARALFAAHPGQLPDQQLVAGDPGTGLDHVQACRSSDGRWAVVYIASGRPVAVAVERLAGARLRASWYDPRTGASQPLGTVARQGFPLFTPPGQGDGCDWALVLDAED